MTTRLLCSLLVLLVLACTQLQTEAYKSIDELYNSLPDSDRQALSALVSSPQFKQFKRKSPDPNFLRFGKRSSVSDFQLNTREPNFLRFGKRADPLSNNFLRFGRSMGFDDELDSRFERENRKPNFLRFG